MKMKQIRRFTMLELITAMAVLVIFMAALIQFFTSSQDVMNRASGLTEQYERARIAMDMMAMDIQSVFYCEGASVACVSTTGTSFRMPVQKDSIVCVGYQFNTTNKTLEIMSAAISDSNTLLTSSTAVSGITGTWTTLIEGVQNFTVTTTGSNGIYPDTIKIEMTLYDADSLAAMKSIQKRDSAASLSAVTLPGDLATEQTRRLRTFTRTFTLGK